MDYGCDVELNTRTFLDFLDYKFGNIIVTCVRFEDGILKQSPKYRWMDFRHESFSEKVKHREQLPFEIILECDNGQHKSVIKFLRENKLAYLDFESNRGHHIHTYWCGLQELSRQEREKMREELISMLRTDICLKSDKHTIALEFTPHWKSGKTKKLIEAWPHGKEYSYSIWQMNTVEQLKDLLSTIEGGDKYVIGTIGELNENRKDICVQRYTLS